MHDVIVGVFLSSDKLLDVLNKGIFILDPILWFPDRFSIERKFGQDYHNVEAS